MIYENRELKGIDKAIEKLPPDQRIVVILKDIQGFSYIDIANFVKCPEGTVKSRLNRGRLH